MCLCTCGVYQDSHVQLSKKNQSSIGPKKKATIEIFTERFVCGSKRNDNTVEC